LVAGGQGAGIDELQWTAAASALAAAAKTPAGVASAVAATAPAHSVVAVKPA